MRVCFIFSQMTFSHAKQTHSYIIQTDSSCFIGFGIAVMHSLIFLPVGQGEFSAEIGRGEIYTFWQGEWGQITAQICPK